MNNGLIKIDFTENFINDLKDIIKQGRTLAYSATSQAMVLTYWNIGKRIVLQEQDGKSRAEYGTKLIETISAELTREFGKGFSPRNLRDYRSFYLLFPNIEIWHSRVPNLTWTHFRMMLRVETPEIREWYMNEASHENWSVRTLDRNIATQYFERRLSAQKNDAKLPDPKIQEENSLDFIKNPVVAEFLGLGQNSDFN